MTSKQTGFTEKDREELKSIISDWQDAYNWQDSSMFIKVRRQQLGRFLDFHRTLLARLEAAEAVCECLVKNVYVDKWPDLKEWLRAAGKEGK